MDIKEYINGRVKEQQKWYEAGATKNKRFFMRTQTWIIVLGAIIPLQIVFVQMFPTDQLKNFSIFISALISAIISILAGFDKLKQPQTNWFNYRANEEMLKKEEWLFSYQAGPYRNLTAEEADKVLVERVESIISADIARVTQNEKNSDEASPIPPNKAPISPEATNSQKKNPQEENS